MAFSATKREWSELYAFMRIMSDGFVCEGLPDLSCTDMERIPVAGIKRDEHDGARRYLLDGEDVHIVGESMDKRFPRSRFSSAADKILSAITQSPGDEVESPDGVEEFLDETSIYDLEANTEDRTDLSISFYAPFVPDKGFIVRSCIGRMTPLLDGGRAANMKYELVGAKLPSPAVSKVNSCGDDEDVLARILMAERLGCSLKFADAADKIFRANLCMIDLRFPRLAGEMVKMMHLQGVTRVNELTSMLEAANPFKIKDELITKNGYYRYKIREFLMAAATGMRPAKIYRGRESAIKGLLLVDADGVVRCYHDGRQDVFSDFLFNNTRLEKGPVQKDKYGYVERENGIYYMKLNLKVGFIKR